MPGQICAGGVSMDGGSDLGWLRREAGCKDIIRRLICRENSALDLSLT